MTTDLEDRLRTTFEQVMPLLCDEPAGEPSATPESVVLIGSTAHPPRSRRVLVAACAAIVIAMVAAIAVVRSRDDVTPANNGPETSIPSAPTTTAAALAPADAPDWYGWIKPFLPVGFDYVAANSFAPGAIYFTAINLETDQSLEIHIVAPPAGAVGNEPIGQLVETNTGYYVNTPGAIQVGVDCGVANIWVMMEDAAEFCDAGSLDKSMRRQMTLALAARSPFTDLFDGTIPDMAAIDLDGVVALMAAALPEQTQVGQGQTPADQNVTFKVSPDEPSSHGTTTTIIRNVYPVQGSGIAPVVNAYGQLSVGWLIRDGVATRLFGSHISETPDQLSTLLGQIEDLVITEAPMTAPAPATSTIVDAVPTGSTPIVTTTPALDDSTGVTYTVQAGDFLVGIARWFCVTAQEMVDANGWTEGIDHSLAVGDVIRVPARACVRGLPAPTQPETKTLLVAGDNVGALTADGLVSIGIGALNEARVSTGIVRTDFFDWPAHLADRLPTLPAGAPVVFAAGGNDGQAFLGTTDPVGSDAWVTEYATRVLKIVDVTVGADHPLVWIGPPDAKDSALQAALDVVRDVTEATLGGVRGVVYVDAAEILSGPDGGYTQTAADLSGNPIVVRSADGNRITPAGQDLITQRVLLALQAQGFPVENVDAFGVYTVQAGDYLGGIAAKTGTTVEGIVAANGWSDERQVLVPGMKIRLPAKPDVVTETVVTGLPTTTLG